MLTQEQQKAFDTQGLVRLPQAIPVVAAEQVCDRIREHVTDGTPIARHRDLVVPTKLQPLTRAGVFDVVGTGSIPTALDDLLGSGHWKRPRHWSRALVTFQNPDRTWDVPCEGWHVDRMPVPGQLTGVTIFVIFARLRPYGGGTLVLAGSHRLFGNLAIPPGSKNRHIRQALGSRHPWLQELWDPGHENVTGRRHRFLDEGAVLDGIPVRVAELAGEPGDAFLMRADTLHTTAPNSLDEPRMMLARTVSAG